MQFGFDKLSQRPQGLKIFRHEVGIINADPEMGFDENDQRPHVERVNHSAVGVKQGLVQCRQWLSILCRDLSVDVVSQCFLHIHELLSSFDPPH